MPQVGKKWSESMIQNKRNLQESIISSAISEMIKDLTQDQLNMLEDYIINECHDDDCVNNNIFHIILSNN